MNPSRPSFRSDRAFTLIELLTVIAIIGVLAGIIIPVVGSVRKSAKKSQCLSNVRQIGIGMKMFSNDNRNRLPYMTNSNVKTWDQQLLDGGYLPKGDVFRCPSDEGIRTESGFIRSYAYNNYVGDNANQSVKGLLANVNKPLANIILVADGGYGLAVMNSGTGVNASKNSNCQTNHREGGTVNKGANYVFADMHAAWVVDTGDYDGNAASVALHNKYWRADLP